MRWQQITYVMFLLWFTPQCGKQQLRDVSKIVKQQHSE